jgi:hypothetical protein
MKAESGLADGTAKKETCGFGLSIIENLEDPKYDGARTYVNHEPHIHHSTRSSLPPKSPTCWNESRDALLQTPSITSHVYSGGIHKREEVSGRLENKKDISGTTEMVSSFAYKKALC